MTGLLPWHDDTGRPAREASWAMLTTSPAEGNNNESMYKSVHRQNAANVSFLTIQEEAHYRISQGMCLIQENIAIS